MDWRYEAQLIERATLDTTNSTEKPQVQKLYLFENEVEESLCSVPDSPGGRKRRLVLLEDRRIRGSRLRLGTRDPEFDNLQDGRQAFFVVQEIGMPG